MLTDHTAPVQPAVLTSWKEIAQHLGKGVRTVQRWEQRFGLPVRRPLGAGHKSTVLARRGDLDQWMTSSWARRARADTLSSNARYGPALKQAIENSRTLQTTNLELLREVSETLTSLLVNCRELRKTRRETEELVTLALHTQMAALNGPPPGKGVVRSEFRVPWRARQ